MKNNDMEINKHNYEAFFLLYTDNELTEEERKAVEDFVEMYPDLKVELNAILQTRLPLEESAFSFDKSNLYRSETTGETINTANHELYFLLYADDELTAEQKALVEEFVAKNPDKKPALDLLLRTKMQPDETITFKNKSLLYRREAPVVSIAVQWRRMIAAASILLIGAFVWMNFDKVKEQLEGNSPRTQIASTPTIEKKETAPAADNQGTIAANEAKTPTEDAVPKATPPEEAKKELQVRIQREQPINKPQVDNAAMAATTEDDGKNMQPEPVPLAVNNPVNEMPVAVNKVVENDNKMPNTLRPEVKPVILDQAAFNDDDDEVKPSSNELALLDTDDTEKKSKGTFRGLFRKASRFVNRATNADGDVAVVRIASFEIAKK